jgi:hypothetical protein
MASPGIGARPLWLRCETGMVPEWEAKTLYGTLVLEDLQRASICFAP